MAAIAVLLSTAAFWPGLDLTWWQVFRRCVSIAAALSLWLTIKVGEGGSFAAYGLSAPRRGLRELVFGLVLGAGGFVLLVAIGVLAGACRIEVTDDTLRLWRTLIVFIPGALLVSVLEELVFRGFLLRQLLCCSRVGAVALSSLIYALVHMRALPTDWAATGRELVGLFLFGAVLCVSCLRTGQLWLSIGLHATLAYGARVNKLLVVFTYTAPMWLTGTSRLVNGVAVWGMILGILGVVWWGTRAQRARRANI